MNLMMCLPFVGEKHRKKLEAANKAANDYLNKPAKDDKPAKDAAAPAVVPAAGAPAPTAAAVPAGTAPVADAPAAGAAGAADQATPAAGAAAPAKPVKTNLDAHKEDLMKAVDMASKFLSKPKK